MMFAMSDNHHNVFLCPGQGAQAIGMARSWCESSPEAAGIMKQADEILDGRLPGPLSEICFEGPSDLLNRTNVSQPAILACSIACFHGLRANNESLSVSSASGLSLGEYTALHLAGVMSFSDALQTVAARGRLMQQAAESSRGGMVALMGAADEHAAESFCASVLESLSDSEVLVCANFNAPGQIVLSGSEQACQAAVDMAGDAGLRAKALPVAGAFHSSLMQPAADEMSEVLESVEMLVPEVPVWSNVTARPHEADVDVIRKRLVEQITSPVRWSQSVQDMLESEYSGFHELAPGKVLKGLMKRIDRKVEVENHDEPDPSYQH